MPKYNETQEDALRKIIRDAMAIDPLISLVSLQNITEKKTGRPLGQPYIIKLQRKVRGEIRVNGDRERYEERVAYLRERNRVICEELFRIAFPSPTMVNPPGVTERRKALEAIARIDAGQIKLEMDLGLFVRKVGEVDVNIKHTIHVLDDEKRSKVIQAMGAWKGIREPRKIKTVAIVKTEPIKTDVPTDVSVSSKSPASTAGTIPRVVDTGLVIS